VQRLLRSVKDVACGGSMPFSVGDISQQPHTQVLHSHANQRVYSRTAELYTHHTGAQDSASTAAPPARPGADISVQLCGEGDGC
jgi:hypothetical protein